MANAAIANNQRANAKTGRSRNSVPVAPAGIGSSLAYGLTMTACDGVECEPAIMNLLKCMPLAGQRPA